MNNDNPEGDGIIDRLKGIYDALHHDRLNIKPSMRAALQKIGSIPIIHIAVVRRPIAKVAETMMKFVQTVAIWRNDLFKRPHDKLFHLFLVCTLKTGQRIVLEKNQDLNIQNYTPNKTDEFMQIRITNGICLIQLVNNAILRFGAPRIFLYDAFGNNCQRFAMDVLTASGLANNSMTKFIIQEVKELVPQWGKKLTNFFTSFANRFDEVIHGRGDDSNDETSE